MCSPPPQRCPWLDHIGVVHASLRSFRTIPAPVREELAQEAILRALQSRGVDWPRAYLLRIAKHLAIDWLRKAREVRLPEDWDSIDASNCWQAEIESRLTIEAILQRAPPKHQRPLRYALRGEDVGTQVTDRLGRTRHTGDDPSWRRARDAVYQQRRRTFSWSRRQVEA